jgi:hypothetical protein
MKNACRWAADNDGLGVWFPSPSEYEPSQFVAALSEVLASDYLRRYRQDTSRIMRSATRRWPTLLVSSFVGLAPPLYILITWSVSPPLAIREAKIQIFLFWLLVLASVGAFVLSMQGRRASRVATGQLITAANDLRQLVRYSVSMRDSRELGGQGGPSRLGASWRYRFEKEFSERPVALASLTTAFRSFAESLPRVIDGPLVLAIDELDKLEDAERATQLLRDIKGVFDIDGVHVLVSVSDEAARQFELGGVRRRNEFNSAFPSSIQLSEVSVTEARQILDRRGIQFMDDGVVQYLTAYSNGLPRELIRSSELVYDSFSRDAQPQNALGLVLKQELSAFFSEASSHATSRPAASRETVSMGLYRALRPAMDSLDGARLVGNQLYELWVPSWSSSRWIQEHGEAWRKLLIRTAVAGIAIELGEESGVRWCPKMKSAIHASSTSPYAGLEVLVGTLVQLLAPMKPSGVKHRLVQHFVDEVVFGSCRLEFLHDEALSVGLFNDSGAPCGPVTLIRDRLADISFEEEDADHARGPAPDGGGIVQE